LVWLRIDRVGIESASRVVEGVVSGLYAPWAVAAQKSPVRERLLNVPTE
jgi:hypothetical protein